MITHWKVRGIEVVSYEDFQEVLSALQLLETAARRFANKLDNDPSYVLKMCLCAKHVLEHNV